MSRVESPVEQKRNNAENSIEVLSKNDSKISIAINSDLISKQNLTTATLFENNEDNTIKHDDQNNTNFDQEQDKLNDTLLNNYKNNTTNGASDKANLNGDGKSGNDSLKNVTNDFLAGHNITKTSQTSQDSFHRNNHENSTTNENTIEDSHLNNSSGNEMNKSDGNITLNKTENITLNNTGNITLNNTENIILNNTENIEFNNTENITFNNTENTTLNNTENITLNNRENVTFNNTENITLINTENITLNNTGNITFNNTENITLDNTENITPHTTTINDHLKKNISNSTIESNHTQIQRLTEQNKESVAYNNTKHNGSVTTAEYINETSLSIDPNITDDSEESTSGDDTSTFDSGDLSDTPDDEDTSTFKDANGVELESDKPTTKNNKVKENKKGLNQKSEGLGIIPKIAIFSINVGFVFVAFWLTKTFIDKRVFQEVFSPNIQPNGYVVGHSEIFLHKSVQVGIFKQQFTENHKTTEYLGVWLF